MSPAIVYWNGPRRMDGILSASGLASKEKAPPIRLYVADLEVRILTFDGKLLR